MARSSKTLIRAGAIGMVLSFLVNMTMADPLPDPVAIVAMIVFVASFVALVVGALQAVRTRRVAEPGA
jgi:hypothetical protein